MQIQHSKQRSWINLGTANKAQAAFKARKLYEEFRANGWAETMRRRRPLDVPDKKVKATIGEYLDAVKAKSAIYLKTVEGYAVALRKIAADIHGLADTREKKSPTHRQAWRASRFNQAANLTAEKIDILASRLYQAQGDRSAQREKRPCVGEQFHPAGTLALRRRRHRPGPGDCGDSDPIPFTGVKVEKVRVPRYRATFDMATLLESAREELATSKPEQFKIFLLAAMAGLRRNEIDKLSWTAFRWDEGIIRIEATQFFRPKTSDSEGDVLVDPELLEIFRGYFARARAGASLSSNPRCRPILRRSMITTAARATSRS